MYSLRIYILLCICRFIYKHLKEKQKQCHESGGSWGIGRKSMKELVTGTSCNRSIQVDKTTWRVGTMKEFGDNCYKTDHTLKVLH